MCCDRAVSILYTMYVVYTVQQNRRLGRSDVNQCCQQPGCLSYDIRSLHARLQEQSTDWLYYCTCAVE